MREGDPHFCRERLFAAATNSQFSLFISPIPVQDEKEEKRRKNMAKARRFDAEFQRELELRRRELQQEEQEGR